MGQIQKTNDSWKLRVYIAGGALFGIMAALIYARAVEEATDETGDLPRIPTGTLVGLILSALSLFRQIAEAGKPNKK